MPSRYIVQPCVIVFGNPPLQVYVSVMPCWFTCKAPCISKARGERAGCFRIVGEYCVDRGQQRFWSTRVARVRTSTLEGEDPMPDSLVDC